MSSVETHRSRLTAQQNRWLVGYLAIAMGLHTAAAIGLTRWNFPLLAQNDRQAPPPIPLDFVYLESAASAPVQATRQAQTNSTAGSVAQPNQPVQAGEIRSLATPAPAISGLAPLVRSQPAPRPTTRQRSAAPSTPRATTAPQPIQASPAAPSPVQAPVVPETASTSAGAAAELQPSPASATGASASALGAPQTLALEGIGLGNRSNANRSGTGDGIDATEDATWGAYLSGLNQLIDQHWQRVTVSATRRTRIQFRVNRQGQLTEWNLLESSGDRAADQAAIQAVRAAAPFAPLPQTAAEEVLIVNFTFTQWLSPASP